MTPDISIDELSTIDMVEVESLYRAVGWTTYADDVPTLSAALKGSSRVVVARREGRLVGLARVISDGATICYLQDVLVDPGEQRRGIGTALVLSAFGPYGAVRQKVLITDDEPRQRAFYESLGFRETRDYEAGSLRAFVLFNSR
jgi:ribosomal protein S18 acetylase RimI-like enzyme